MISNVFDYWNDFIPNKYPWAPTYPPSKPITTTDILQGQIDSLRKDIEELKKMILAAKEFDKNTGQPNCEDESKTALLKKLAKALDIDISKIVP